jgi:hypothetical protein
MLSEKLEKLIPNAFGKVPQDLKDPQNCGSFLLKTTVIPHLEDFYSLPRLKKSEKKGKSPLEFTRKAYIFVDSNIHPKILSMNNLSCANYLEKPYLFNYKIGNMKFNIYIKNFILFYFSLVQEK